MANDSDWNDRQRAFALLEMLEQIAAAGAGPQPFGEAVALIEALHRGPEPDLPAWRPGAGLGRRIRTALTRAANRFRLVAPGRASGRSGGGAKARDGAFESRRVPDWRLPARP